MHFAENCAKKNQKFSFFHLFIYVIIYLPKILFSGRQILYLYIFITLIIEITVMFAFVYLLYFEKYLY